MLRLRHILFPYDFSERCDATAPFVAAMARQFDARITMLSVSPPVWQNAPSDSKAAAVVFDPKRMQMALDQVLEGALRDAFEGLKVERIAQHGDPASIITDYAHTKRVDLVMMPTHGFGPFRSLLLGSVTAKVLHDSRCPVWTAAHLEDPPLPPEQSGGLGPVLCAVDGTPKSVALMKWAADWADTTKSELEFVHAVHSISDLPRLKSERALQRQAHQDAEQIVEKQRKEAGVDSALRVIDGDIQKVVRDEALRLGAALVLIGRGVLHGTLGRLRTHAYGIIRESPCPVLSV